MAYESLMVFTGNANPLLAHAVVRRLNIPLGHATVGKFSDGEVMVELLENVRGKDCFVLQSTCAPANDSLMEVLLTVDALKRASAALGARRDQREGFGEHASGRGCGPRADHGPARGSDPGLFRRAGGQHLRNPGAARGRVEAPVREPAGGLSGRGRSGPGARDGEAPGVGPGDH